MLSSSDCEHSPSPTCSRSSRQRRAPALAAPRLHRVPGSPELRDASRRATRGAPDDVLTLAAAEEGIFIAYHALLEPGDHAVVETPCYGSAVELARSTGAEVSRVAAPARGRLGARPRRARAAAAAGHAVRLRQHPAQPDRHARCRARCAAVVELVARARRDRALQRRGLPRARARRGGPAARCLRLYDRALSLGTCRRPTACPGCGSAGSRARDRSCSSACASSSSTRRSARAPPANARRARAAAQRAADRRRPALCFANLPLLGEFIERRAVCWIGCPHGGADRLSARA